MGPLQQLYGMLLDRQRSDEINARRARLGADDPGGTIYLDREPSFPMRQGDGNIDLPANYLPFIQGQSAMPPPNMAYRDAAQGGPAPPDDAIGPIARMYGRGR